MVTTIGKCAILSLESEYMQSEMKAQHRLYVTELQGFFYLNTKNVNN